MRLRLDPLGPLAFALTSLVEIRQSQSEKITYLRVHDQLV